MENTNNPSNIITVNKNSLEEIKGLINDNVLIVNEKNISNIIELLYSNIKDSTDNIEKLSKSLIIDYSRTHMSIVINICLEYISNYFYNTSDNTTFNVNLENYCCILIELIEKHFKLILKDNLDEVIISSLNKMLKSFIILNSNINSSSTNTDIDSYKKQEKRIFIVNKILLKIAKINFKKVIEILLDLFDSGNIPNKFIITTLCNLADLYSNNVYIYYPKVISKLIPILSCIKDDTNKANFCKFFTIVAEACIIESNNDVSIDNSISLIKDNKNLNDIKPLFLAIFDHVKSQWLDSTNNRILTINCIILLSCILPENNEVNVFDNIINLFCEHFKKSNNKEDNIMLLKSFRLLLENNYDKLNQIINDSCIQILNTIFPSLINNSISPNVNDFDSKFAKLKSEVLQIINLLITNCFNKTYTFLVLKLDSNILLEKLSSIYVLKSLLIRVIIDNEANKEMLISSINKLTCEKDLELKYSLIEIIAILIEKKYFTFESFKSIISFLIKESRYTDEIIEQDIKNSMNSNNPFLTNIKMIRERAEITLLSLINDNKVLNNINNNNNNNNNLILAFCLEHLVDENYYHSSYILGKIIIQILVENKKTNKIDELYSLFNLKNDTLVNKTLKINIPSSCNIIIIIYILLVDPFKRHNYSFCIIKLLKEILSITLKDVINCLKLDFFELESYLKRGKYFEENDYLDLLLKSWEKVVYGIKDQEINILFIESLIKLLTSSKNFTLINFKNNNISNTNKVRFALSMCGPILNNLDKREIILDYLNRLFSYVYPELKHDIIDGNLNVSNPSKVIKIGLSNVYGIASKNHLDLVLNKINSIFKAEIQGTKSSGFASLFSAPKEFTLSESIKSTLILCLGCICKNTNDVSIIPKIKSNFLKCIEQHFSIVNFDIKNNHSVKQVINERYNKYLTIYCLESLKHIFSMINNIMKNNSKLKQIDFILEDRDNYLETMSLIFDYHKSFNTIKLECLFNIAYLIELNPPISMEKCLIYINHALSVFENIDLFENKKELINSAISASLDVFTAITVHESYSSTNPSNIDLIQSNRILYNNHKINYKENYNLSKTYNINNNNNNDKQDFIFLNEGHKILYTSWDLFSIIIENLFVKYIQCGLNDTKINNRNLKQTMYFEQIKNLINKKKCFKYNSIGEQCSWVICLIILLYLLFEDNHTVVSRHEVLICILRIITSCNNYNITEQSTNEEVIKEIKTILENFDVKEVAFFIDKLLYLIIIDKKTNINVVNNICKMLNSLITSENFIYNSNIHNNSLIKKDYELLMCKLVNSVENLIQLEGESSNVLAYLINTAEQYVSINLNIFIKLCFNERYGIPFPLSLCVIIKNVSKDENKLKIIFSTITDVLNNEGPGIDNKPNYEVCASTIMLGLILKDTIENYEINNNSLNNKAYDKIVKFFPQLLSTIIIRIGSTHSINYAVNTFESKELDPRNQSVWALQKLIKYSQHNEVSSCLETGGSIQIKLMKSSEYDEGIYELIMICCLKLEFKNQVLMFEFMKDFLDRTWTGQRVVVIASIAQFIYSSSNLNITSNNDKEINEWRSKLVEELIKALSDSDELARKMAIRGLANLTKVYLDACNNIDNYINSSEIIKGN